MIRLYRFGVKLAAGACFVLASVSAADARGYRIDRIDVTATIRADGSVRIVERRVYSFRGAFTRADYLLPLRGIASVDSFWVREGGRAYLRTDTDEPGSYRISVEGDSFRATWYFRARNQTRVFKLGFLLRGVVKAHADVAEFCHRFIGAGRDGPVGEVVVRLGWQTPASPDSIRVWTHGPLWGRSAILPDGRVEMAVAPLPRDEAWEGRVIFPLAWVPGLRKSGEDVALERILAEEAAWAREASARRLALSLREERLRERRRHSLWFVSFLSLAATAVFVHLYLTHGRRHATPQVAKYESAPPSDTPPALVSYLLRRTGIGSNAVVATMLDLARRGFLRVEAITGQRRRWRITEATEYLFRRVSQTGGAARLDAWEEDVLVLLFEKIARGGDCVSAAEIRRARPLVARWFPGWKRKVIEEGERRGYYEADSVRARNKGLAVSISLIVIGILDIFLAREVGLIPIAVGTALLMGSFALVRRSAAAELEARKWRAFARYLKEYGRSSGLVGANTSDAEAVLPYAVVFGLDNRLLTRLVDGFVRERPIPWFAFVHGGAGPTFGHAVARMIGSLSSTIGSATGVGGGAGGTVGGAG